LNINSLILLIVFSFFSCGEKKGNSESLSSTIVKNRKKTNVIATIVDKTGFNKQIVANGKVEVLKKNKLKFKSNNIIQSLNIYNGKKVTKGQILATLENSLQSIELEKAKISLSKAKNLLEKEKINYGEENLTNKRLNALLLKSGVLEAKNNLKKANLEYSNTVLKAPFSGIIANLDKKKGDYISPSEILCTIIDPNNIEVIFSILENEYPFVRIGQDLEIESFFNSDKKNKGMITQINPLVDKNGLIKIKAQVINSNSNLIDGMNVKIFISEPVENVLVVPKEAVVLRKNKNIVFTLEKGLAKWNYINIIDENSKNYVISQGIKFKDTIIISGNLNLSHDTKVNAVFYDKIDMIKD